MEGTDEGEAANAAVDEAIRRDALGLVRFASAFLGARDEATRLVEEALVEAAAAVQAKDTGAVLRARLFGLVRRKAAQLIEQRRRASDKAKLSPHPFLEHVRPTEREALLLRYVGGLSTSDVAAAAAVDEATLRQRLSRGIAFLCRLDGGATDLEPASPEVAKQRSLVEEALSDIVDGLGSDEIADFVAADDVSRDMVHDAEKVVEKLRGLESADGLEVADLTQRFVRACAAARVEATAPAPAAEVTAPAQEATVPAATATVPAATATAPEATATAPEATATAPAEKPSEALAERLARRKRAIVALGVAATVGAFALVVSRSGDTGRYADTAWSGKVGSISRAFGGGVGLERCSPDRAVCSRVDSGDDVPAGSTLRTDGQSRAVLELRDGTHIVLDRDSELMLDGSYARRARLDHGSLVVDVPPQGESRARFDLPLGFVEAESTKVSLVARASRSDAEVARGAVRLVDSRERGVAVHAGEVGTLEPGEAPAVYPSASLGDRFGWTERAFSKTPAAEETIRGLGELGAKRPQDDHERKGLVTLASHTTRVRIVGNVARTEIEEEFTSSSDDVLEGIFRFPLPPDAQIERLALDVDGKIEEGAFVDRDRASAIWRGAIVNAGAKKPVSEEIVWVPGPWRDPALLEWQRGGRFELRIYPIPKRASRKVLLTYTQVIAPSGGLRRYVYPLPYDPSGSTRVGRFDVDVEVRGNDGRAGVVARGYGMRQQALPDGVTQLSLVAQGFSPSGDLVIEYSLPDSGQEVTAWAYQPGPDEQAGGGSPADGAAYVALALRPKLPRTQDAVERDFALVVDSSRSMFGERYRRAAALAGSIVREMDRADRVTVLACDSTCRELPGGPVAAGPEAAGAVADFLHGVTPEGGSDIAAAIRRAGEALRGAPRGGARIVYIGDGTPTIGPVGPAFVRREIEAAVSRDFGTVTAVAIGSDADVSTLKTLSDAGGGVLVPYTPGQTLLDTAFALLGATYGTTLTDAEVELPEGLFDAAPRRAGTLRAGSETIVVARMNGSAVAGTLTLRGKVGGAPFEQRYPVRIEATTAKGNAFVPRLWAAAKIGELELTPDVENRRQAIELSGRFHVASRYTSLLVLESAAMMQAFGLRRDERTALWTGDSAAESTAADGETAILDADDGRGMLSGNADLSEGHASGGGLGAPSGQSPTPSRGGRVRPAPLIGGESPAAAAEPAPAPRPAPKAAAREERESLYARGDDKPEAVEKKKSEAFSPPPPAATSAPSKPDNRRARDALAIRPPDVDMTGPALMQSPFTEPPPPRFGRRYIPMRKIWERVGRIVAPATIPSSVTPEAITSAERDASGADPRRDALKRLYTLYLLDGRVDSAAGVAERWSAKDPLDPDALTARADIAAARGERDLAIRILGSVIDVRPGDHKAVFRLARLHRWAQRPELSCRHSMAAAEIRSTDAALLAEAVRCSRDLGEAAVAADLMAASNEATRRAADTLLAAKPADPSQLSGDLRLEATWDGGDDLDLSLLPPDGARVSWLGAPTRAVITARDVDSTSREGLGLRGSAPGDYVVEVTRPAGHRGLVRGSVAVYAAGDRRTVPFAFDGPSARIAVLKITTRSRLVPL